MLKHNNKSNSNAITKAKRQRTLTDKTFVARKIKLDPISESAAFASNPQYNAFPKYQFEENDHDKVILITDPIKLTKGGIPNIDEKWRPNDNSCMYLWLPISKDEPSSAPLHKTFEGLDDYTRDKIAKDKNFITFSKDPKTLDSLEYVDIIKTTEPRMGADGKEIPGYDRIKLDIATIYDPKTHAKDSTDIKKLNITVYINNSTDKDVVRYKKKEVSSLDELRALVPWNSTIRCAIEIYKFYIAKTKNSTKKRLCGYKLKVHQIYVTERPTSNYSNNVELEMGVFGINEDDIENDSEDEVKPKKTPKSARKLTKPDPKPEPKKEKTKVVIDEDTDEEPEEEDEDTNSGEEDEEDKPDDEDNNEDGEEDEDKPDDEDEDNNDDESSEAESSAAEESEEEEEPPKPVKKSTGKKAKK